jgi:hypothetical protein
MLAATLHQQCSSVQQLRNSNLCGGRNQQCMPCFYRLQERSLRGRCALTLEGAGDVRCTAKPFSLGEIARQSVFTSVAQQTRKASGSPTCQRPITCSRKTHKCVQIKHLWMYRNLGVAWYAINGQGTQMVSRELLRRKRIARAGPPVSRPPTEAMACSHDADEERVHRTSRRVRL